MAIVIPQYKYKFCVNIKLDHGKEGLFKLNAEKIFKMGFVGEISGYFQTPLWKSRDN